MGTRKLNPFMKFMATFRKQNKGKYDFKQMGREAGKAWRKVKGGANKTGLSDWDACKFYQENIGEKLTGPDKIKYDDCEAQCHAARPAVSSEGGRNRRTQKRRR
jgi:hypothetical protein